MSFFKINILSGLQLSSSVHSTLIITCVALANFHLFTCRRWRYWISINSEKKTNRWVKWNKEFIQQRSKRLEFEKSVKKKYQSLLDNGCSESGEGKFKVQSIVKTVQDLNQCLVIQPRLISLLPLPSPAGEGNRNIHSVNAQQSQRQHQSGSYFVQSGSAPKNANDNSDTLSDSKLLNLQLLSSAATTIANTTSCQFEPLATSPFTAVNILTSFTNPASDNSNMVVNVNIDVVINMNMESIRGVFQLPHSTGKAVKLCVFCEDDLASDMIKAGATFAGEHTIIERVMKGAIKFDKCITTNEFMPRIIKLGKVLGPQGLMPNKRSGTIVANLIVSLVDIAN